MHLLFELEAGKARVTVKGEVTTICPYQQPHRMQIRELVMEAGSSTPNDALDELEWALRGRENAAWLFGLRVVRLSLENQVDPCVEAKRQRDSFPMDDF